MISVFILGSLAAAASATQHCESGLCTSTAQRLLQRRVTTGQGETSEGATASAVLSAIGALQEEVKTMHKELKEERAHSHELEVELRAASAPLTTRAAPHAARAPVTQDEHFESCKAHASQSFALSQQHAAVSSNASYNLRQECKGPSEVPLLSYKAASPYFTIQCCPVFEQFCAGCAIMQQGRKACNKCQGGFSKNKNGICEPCIDHPGWKNKNGQNCFKATCSDEKFQGFSSNEACCKCLGGGQREATKFQYHVGQMALGASEVTGFPIPRTATLYSVDNGCELAKHGLTLDPTTGQLKFRLGCTSVGCGSSAAFTVSCTITAHQAVGLTASATLSMSVGAITYGDGVSPILLMDGETITPSKSSPMTVFSDFTCAPDAAGWLTMEDTTGKVMFGKPLICSDFDCGPKHILKPLAAGIFGSSIPKCCNPVCSAWACPKHYLPIHAAAKTAGNSTKKCCDAVCTGVQCPRNFVLLKNSATIRKNDIGSCCEPVCSGFSCPKDYILLNGHASIRGNSRDVCCEKLCSGFECAGHTLLKKANATIRGFKQDTCCEPACSGVTCPSHFLSVPDAAKIHGNTNAICCVDACSSYTCGSIYVLKPKPASIRGKSQAICCEKAGDPGLLGSVYDLGGWEEFQDKLGDGSVPRKLEGVDVEKNITSKKINFAGAGAFGIGDLGKYFFVSWKGLLRIAKSGEYSFQLNSDDGSKLWVKNKEVIDNHGIRSPSYGRRRRSTKESESERRRRDNQEKHGKIFLSTGIVPIQLNYAAKTGYDVVLFRYKGPDTSNKWVWTQHLFHRSESTDLTAPADPAETSLLGNAYQEDNKLDLSEIAGISEPENLPASESDIHEQLVGTVRGHAFPAETDDEPPVTLLQEEVVSATERDTTLTQLTDHEEGHVHDDGDAVVRGGVEEVAGVEAPAGGACSVKTPGGMLNMLILAPKAAPSISYESSSFFASLGEVATVLPSKLVKHPGTSPPTRFSANCNPAASFAFDTLTGLASYDGYHLFSLDIKTGAVRLEPDPHLATTLDLMQDSLFRRKLNLMCVIFAHHEWPPLGRGPILSSALSLEVRDDTCWASAVSSFAASRVTQNFAHNENECRKACRSSSTCSHYAFSGGCHFYSGLCANSQDSACKYKNVKVTERSARCGEKSSCIQLNLVGLFYMSGAYCPAGESPAGEVYVKKGLTPEESFWLQRYEASQHDVKGCNMGDYLIRKIDPAMDYENNTLGYTELHGEVVACVGAQGTSGQLVTDIFGSQSVTLQVRKETSSSASAQVVVPGCMPPNITANIDEGADQETSGPSVIVLDDPSTTVSADHWLHPCDCIPPAWGPLPPVESEAFASIPAGSNNKFQPPPFRILEGQFVCPQATLFDILVESETQLLDEGVCKATCLSYDNCKFYWEGEVGSAKQCRFYSDCSHLVREVGIIGALYEQIRDDVCQIADPNACWETSKRRNFLRAGDDNHPCVSQALLEECDHKLMLGGLGVVGCARCTYAPWDGSGNWVKKTPMPKAFSSGQQLTASCWAERYAFHGGSSESLSCVSGSWLNSKGKPGLEGFSCESCIQVVSKRYAEFDQQERQELFFVSGMKVTLAADSNPVLFVQDNGLLAQGPPTIYSAQINPEGPESSRQFRSEAHRQTCLQAKLKGKVSTLGAATCAVDSKQFLEPIEFSSLFWEGFKSSARVPKPESQGLSKQGTGPITMRNFGLTMNCKRNIINSIKFSTDKSALGMSAKCVPANTIHAPKHQKKKALGSDNVRNEKFGTCMSLSTNKPFVLKIPAIKGNKCLHAHTNKYVYSSYDCNRHSTRQQWIFKGKMLQNIGTGLCLDANTHNDYVYVHNCHAAKNQQWYLEDYEGPYKFLKNYWNNECTTGEGTSYKHHTCNRKNNKTWFVPEQISGKGVMVAEHYDCTDDESSQLAVQVNGGSKNTFNLITDGAGEVKDVWVADGLLKVWGGALLGKGNRNNGEKCLAAIAAGTVAEHPCDRGKKEQKWVIANAMKSWAEVPVTCPPGQLIEDFRKDTDIVQWWCIPVASIGACTSWQTPQVSTKGAITSRKQSLKDLEIGCEAGRGLKGFEAETSDKGDWLRFRYTCCQISEVATAITPYVENQRRSFVSDFAETWEGIYCPTSKGVDGRIGFTQTRSFGSWPTNPKNTFYYVKETGKWCLHTKACASSDMVSPLDDKLSAGVWQVVPVSDFDGNFEAKGVKPQKKTRRKGPPPLIKFGAPDPEYAPECKDESHPGAVKFDAEQMNKEAEALDDENPCKYVYGKAPTKVTKAWPSGPSSDGDGMSWWQDDMQGSSGAGASGVTYKTVKECADREIGRDWAVAVKDYDHDMKALRLDRFRDVIDIISPMIPDVDVEPLGFGVSFPAGDALGALGNSIVNLVERVSDMKHLTFESQFAEADNADCSSLQHGLARTFCDLHCIRDAVRQGDAAILQGLEGAVEVVGKNTQMLLEHYVGDPEEKKDSSLLQEQEAVRGLRGNLGEIMSMAKTAAFKPSASSAIERAVRRFSEKLKHHPASLAAASSNTSERLAHFNSWAADIQQLKDLLATATRQGLQLSQTEEIRLNTMQSITFMNARLKSKNQVLGIYQVMAHHGRRHQTELMATTADVLAELREESVAASLQSMDAIWWQLRTGFDAYLDAAQKQSSAMAGALAMLESYTSRCASGFSSLRMAYAETQRAENEAHKVLQETWKAAVPKLGLLASQMADTDMMGRLAAADVVGLKVKVDDQSRKHTCKQQLTKLVSQSMQKGLWGQTQRQLSVAFNEMSMLAERFVAGSLGVPDDVSLVDESQSRIRQAVNRSMASAQGHVHSLSKEYCK